MKKIRLFLTVIAVMLLGVSQMQARIVGDRFTVSGVTYEITSLENMTVGICDFTLTGAVTFPATVKDSTATTFRVTSITDNTYLYFSGNKSAVTSLTFLEGFEVLCANSIREFHNLTTISLPSTLKEVERCSILDDPKLTAIYVAPTNPYFQTVGGALYSKDGTILYKYPEASTITSLTIPSGVTTIKSFALAYLSKLTTVTIPASVTDIGSPLLYACRSATTINVDGSNPNFSSVSGMLCNKAGDELILCPSAKNASAPLTLPAQIKVLRTNSILFGQQSRLLLPDVEIIQSSAFAGCAFQDVTFYPSLREIRDYSEGNGLPSSAIGDNNAITKFIISGTNNYFAVDAIGVLYSKDYTKLIKFPSRNPATTYTTHPNTRIIGHAAFRQTTNLQIITITKDVEEIGAYAFLRVATLANITFQETSQLKKIWGRAFENMLGSCSTIVLPASVESIGDGAFVNCKNLKTISVKGNSPLAVIGSGVFAGCSNLTTFEFTAPIQTIGDRAFANCPKFLGKSAAEGFVVPKNVTKIGESAFNGCSSLTKVTFDDNAVLDTIGFCAFQNTGLTAIDIPKSVRFIGNEAFNSCQQLKAVTIPAATTYVGPQAFLFCGQLREILVDKNNPNYSSVDGMFASKDKKTLYAFPAGKADTYYTMLSPSFETINDSAFYYMRNLRSVTIPKRVTRIGEHAFALCPNLERINFLANTPIDDVHAEAFIDMQRNSRLKDIDIYVRKGRRDAYVASDFWGNGGNAGAGFKSKSINEAFLVSDSNGSVEYFPLSPTDASIVDVHSDVTTLVVPQTVTNTADSKTYSVKLIGDYAFEDCTKDIEEVVVPGSIALNYIGARAFIKKDTNLKPVKSVFIVNATPAGLATSIFGLHDPGVTDNYDEVESGQTIYVKKAATADYKAAWPTMAGQIDYKIPGINLTKTYGTFAREFDVDLADYFAEYGAGKVYAFTSAPDQTIYEGRGDGSEPGTWYIRMYSINENQNGDGIYIPAYTGVMLKSMDGAATPTESAANGAFYYTIGDSTTVNTNVSSVLMGVTVRNREVKDTNKDIYVMSGGLFKPLNGQTVASFPVHKAYLQLPSSNYPGANTSGAKLVFLFDGVPTEIDAFGIDGGLKTKDDGGPVYDLQGRRVNAPQKGIYVRNGKKIVIK